MLVTSNLLFLKQIEKAPALAGASPLEATDGTQPLCLEEFRRNPFEIRILQAVTAPKLLTTWNLCQKYPSGGRGTPGKRQGRRKENDVRAQQTALSEERALSCNMD
jgi:hypothetical protein